MKQTILLLAIQLGMSQIVWGTEQILKKGTSVNESQTLKYGEVIKLKEGQELQFPDFKLVFVMEENPEANSQVKSTADIHIRHFLVSDKNGEQKLDIVHGQLPPKDAKLKLTSGNYIIHTHSSPKGEKLFPHSLVVSKK